MSASASSSSSSSQPTLTLNTGATIPLLGFGTFLAKKGEVAAALKVALTAGYRHIDCASIYGNEAEVGEALASFFNDASSGIKRSDVFITSKLWVDSYHPDKVRPALEKTLKDLQLTYLDLYLMHVPVACTVTTEGEKTSYKAARRAGYSLLDTWRSLEACYDAKLARAIGISNFPAALVNDFQNAARIVPAVHQVELHPYLAQPEFVKFNTDLGIVLTAYAPLGAPDLMKNKYDDTVRKPLMTNDVIVAIAKKHSVTPAQVLIRWSIDRGITVIPKSVTPDRIKANFNVFGFKLDADDLSKIKALDCGHRTFGQDHLGVPTFM